MFLKIKNIPKVSWSSEKPLNLIPKISTFFILCFVFTLFDLHAIKDNNDLKEIESVFGAKIDKDNISKL